ncbi:MAG: aldo/keto reductase [Chloroflexi bacterium]|nr:aldo/keto reductase [Chloroflexota bacterium]
MKYRSFGNTGIQVSALGFGCMRLPTLGKYEEINEPEAISMIRKAVDAGVNYVDTAYGYHGGNSERVVGKALADGYRDKVYLATKLPVWLCNKPEDFDRLLNEQLERLHTDHIDFYLLHSLNKDSWHKVEPMGVIPWAEGALADGRIRHLGFSFHDDLATFKSIVDYYDKWSFCQIQYNYLNETVQAGTEGLHYAAKRGMAVVVMEPLLGGRLANPPQQVQELWRTAAHKRTPVNWALQWLWNQPEVSLCLSGMSTMGQVEQNLTYADESGVGTLQAGELELVSSVRDRYNELCPVPCTACQYCMPCPNGVDIPGNFAIFNDGSMYNELEQSRNRYARMQADKRASECIACRECESKCPQHIPISEWMPFVQAVLAENETYTCIPADLARV